MRSLLASLASLAAGVSACGGGDVATSFAAVTEPAITTVSGGAAGPDSSGAAGSSTTTGVEGSTSTSSSGGNDTLVLDMGMPDFGSVVPAGCQGKIDFLFVISASGTMKGTQQQLVSSFPGFMAAIEEKLPEFDVHIISASTYSTWPLDDCKYCTGDGCDPQASPPTCGAELDYCDKHVIGAGVTFPVGEGASNRRCELYDGNRYIVDGEPDVTEAFTCIAQVGLHGAASVAEGMVNALLPEINAPLGCNSGFLRDDALLVVTLIQDTYDQQSAGSVADWIEALRTAKHGDDDAYVVLVLTTDVDVSQWELCHYGEYSPLKNPLRLLAEGVEHGFIGSICEESYDPFFSEAVDEVVAVCENFVPPG